MAFCINCGQEIKSGAKFCYNCGTAVYVAKTENDNKDRTKRRTVYDGELHKCPNCGEIINSFEARCSACGWEIRYTQSSDAVRKLAEKLERIEARQMPHIEEKKSVMKMVFGRDFKEKDEVEEARNAFENQKEEEKADLISNFPVPNTKEDILEFMLLASSNINLKKGIDDVVSKAWIAKLEQVYQRAQLTMGKSSDFATIKSIYDRKKAELKNRKFKGLAIAAFVVGGYAILFGMLFLLEETSASGVIAILIGIASLLVGIKFISIYNKNRKQNL